MLRNLCVQSMTQGVVPRLLQLRHRGRDCSMAVDADYQIFRNSTPDPLCLDAPFYRYSLDVLRFFIVASNYRPAGIFSKENGSGKQPAGVKVDFSSNTGDKPSLSHGHGQPAL